MSGDNLQRTQDVGRRLRVVRPPRAASSEEQTGKPVVLNVPEKSANGERRYRKQKVDEITAASAARRRSSEEKDEQRTKRRRERLEVRKDERQRVYKRRRIMATALVALGIVALVVAVLVPATISSDPERAIPIDPNEAGPATTLASVGGVNLSIPVRPSELTGLGYHAEGQTFSEMEPVGTNLSTNPLIAMFSGSSGAEDIRYQIMDSAGREGSSTGALDVGAAAGSKVYSPVTGMITSIRPDPSVENANIVEIQPSDNPNYRVSVSLVQSEDGSAGVKSPVDAGTTELGVVADSAAVLEPQLSGYIDDPGNHVTVTVSHVG